MVSVSIMYNHIQYAAVPLETLRRHIVDEIVLEEPMADKQDIWSKSRCGMGCVERERIDYVPYFKIIDQDVYIRGDTHRELFFSH